MDIGIFDNLDDDGQLTLFGLEEDFGELPEPLGGQETGGETPGKKAAEDLGKRPAREEKPGHLQRQSAGKEPSGDSCGQETGGLPGREKAQEPSGELPGDQGSTGIRIRRCSSCGKLLFVREEDGGYYSACNACGIQYVQK